MAKFCGNCGAQLDDTAKVCGHCGTPLSAASGTDDISGIEYGDPEKKALIKKRVKLGAVCAAGVALIVCIIIFIASLFGPKPVAKKVIKAFKEDDAEILTSIASPIVLENAYADNEDNLQNYYEAILKDYADYFEDKTDDGYKLSGKITKNEKLSDSKVKKIREKYDLDKKDITEIRFFKIELTAKADGKSKTQTVKIYLSKEKGKWYLFWIDGRAEGRAGTSFDNKFLNDSGSYGGYDYY